ncbi:MAG: hypothetical protein V1838_03595 [Patescibacteria group bacterium]
MQLLLADGADPQQVMDKVSSKTAFVEDISVQGDRIVLTTAQGIFDQRWCQNINGIKEVVAIQPADDEDVNYHCPMGCD